MSEPVAYRKPVELRRLGRRHAIVEASAGTGKTYVLEHLVVDLLLRAGATMDQILVVTFTEKATAELTTRLRRKLASLSELRPGDVGAVDAAAPADEDLWLIDDPARERLRRALLGFDRAHILTIHAFCQRILTENAFIQGRLFDEEVIDEREAFSAAFVETLRNEVRAGSAEATLIEAWRGVGNPLGKLERLLFETQKRLSCVYPPRPSALQPPAAFDAARLQAAVAAWPSYQDGEGGDGETRVRQLLKQKKIHPSTAGAWLRRLAEVNAVLRALGGAGPAALLGAVEMLDRAYTARTSSKDKEKEKRPPKLGLFRELADCLEMVPAPDQLVDQLARAARAIDAAAPPLMAALAQHLLPAVSARLEQGKRAAGRLDFQDMLALVARGLEPDRPEAAELVAALRARYRYALVDEFQDTDETQWQIFRRLFFEPGAPGVLTLVGDPKQAIYSFRGADVHTYLRARREIGAVQEPLFLTASYRSTAALTAAQNALLDQRDPAAFFRAAGPIHYDHPVSCGQPELALLDARGAPAAPLVVFDIQRSEQAPTPKLRLWEIKPALLERIAREIGDLLSPAGALSLRAPDGRSARIGPRDIFVLTRTVRESREVGEALRARRIPFAYFKQEKLFETVEARAVLDLLRALAEPDDRSARFRAFITPFFGLSLLDLSACDDLPADHPLVQRLERWRALGEGGQVDQMFASILDDSGVVSRELFDQGVKGRASERALANYLHLFELMQREAAQSPCTLRELAQRLGGYVANTRRPADRDGNRTSDVQRLETDADAVQIMTIHHAKGLEASVVFLYGATWPGPRGDARLFHDGDGQRVVRVGRQPTAEEDAYLDEQADEERRVLYVGLTRARARLYLPRFPARSIISINGAYGLVNDRLNALLGGITPDEVRRLFQLDPLPCPRPADAGHPDGRATPGGAGADAIRDWQPPAALLAPPHPDPAFREAAANRAGFVVTSYSAIRASHPHAPPDAEPAAADDAGADSDLPAPLVAPPASDELPRGRLSGTFLHDLIEHLPLDSLARAPVFEDWRRLPEVGELFERMRRRHDRDPAHLAHAQRLVHTALAVPVRLGDTIVPALGGAERPTREMEFLFPIPSLRHPGLSPGPAGSGDAHGGAEDLAAWRIERGVVKGFIDYLFEHQGRVYVCDWKSDSLPGWEPAGLAARCDRDYAVQAQIYTVAAARLLGLRDAAAFESRFGGVLYCFLRGMRADDPQAGVYFRRPDWADVLGWQRAMLEPRYWGLA